MITTKDGSGEMATEIGRGIGKITDGGKKVRLVVPFSEHLQQGSWLSSTISLRVSLSMKEMKLEILVKKSGNGNSIRQSICTDGGHFQHSIILFYYLTFSNCFIVRMQMKID